MGQVLYPPAPFPVPLPTTLAASTGTWTSGLLFNDGYRILTIGVLMTQAGTLAVTPYIDLAGTMARVVTNSPFTIAANTLLIVDLPPAPVAATPGNFFPPFCSFTITINNTALVTATITSFQVLLSAG